MSHRAELRMTRRVRRGRAVLARGWPLAAALILAVLGALAAAGVEEELTPG
ncbi:hypothetical protein G6026_07855, partial [Dietzia sp. DQ11-38-2]|nr:hypothetical protein [Dietzia sp. DQ11-38-2]